MLFVDVTPRVWERLLAVRRVSPAPAAETGVLASAPPWISTARWRDATWGPVTVAQIGQSLDGRVATVTGDARDVSGPDGLAHLHRMRALVDGVVIGVRTALTTGRGSRCGSAPGRTRPGW
jgi:hypothetical protein